LRWVNEVSHIDEPNIDNAIFLLDSQLKVTKALARGDHDFDILEDVCREVGIPKSVKFLKTDQPYVVNRVENGSHGDRGINGSRGSIKGFTKVGIKYTIGHSHTTGIIEGVYQNGCLCDLNADYTSGPSSWSHSSTIQYSSGTRSIITCINGSYFGKVPKKAKL